MIRERWWVDSYEFTQGDIRDVEYRDGLLSTPPMRGANVVIPNRTGQLWRAKRHDQATFSVQLWWGTTQSQAQTQFDNILRAATPGHRLCTWKRVTPLGEVRSCLGEVVGGIKPTAIGQNGYRASIDVTVPGGYWTGDTLYTAASPAPATGATHVDVTLTDLAPSTAVIEDLVLRIDGLATNPRIDDLTNLGRGEWVSYAGTVAKGQALTLDCNAWTATGSGGLTVNQAAVSYAGDRFLAVAPDPGYDPLSPVLPRPAPVLRLSASTLGPNAQLTVSGHRKYLI